MQELLAKEQQEEQLLRDITGVQVTKTSIGISQAVLTVNTRPHRGSLVHLAVLQRLEDVTFLDAVVDCTETSLSSLGEVRKCCRVANL